MSDDPSARRRIHRLAIETSSLGLTMALMLAGGVYGGLWLDEWWGCSPLFTMLGSFLGLGLGFYAVLAHVQRMEAREKQDRAPR